ARHHQSSRGRHAGADPDGRRRHRRAVWRTGRPAHETGTVAAAARTSGAERRPALRDRSAGAAQRALLDPRRGRRHMTRAFAIAALAAVMVSASGAAFAERLISSM